VFSWWEAGQRVVQEVESGDDTDSEGVGLDSTGTGIDRGLVRSRRAGGSRGSSEESGSEDEGQGHLSVAEREDALYESAMARIRRAEEKGLQEVHLTKDELAAMERRRQREAEERRRRREKKRGAIPLSQLTSGFGSMRNSMPWDSPPRSSSDVSVGRTPSRGAADRELEDSPFEYAYVNPDTVASSRHASDSAAGRPHAKVNARSDTASPASRTGSTHGSIDPFQFITSSARPSPLTSSAPSRRRASPDVSYITSESPTSLRRTPDSDSDSSAGEHSPRPHPARVNSSESGRARAIEAPPAGSRREPERRSTRDRSPVLAPSSSKRVTATSQPQRRKSTVVGSTAAKSKRKGK